ncbi:AAA family ATPase [Dechloromonas sp. ARDL1]|uniref:AAA family ATPase n=1 Tax=Dechloromonas sp. ARDL1 TaxID=3322121 RepID=UPI003DA75084
MAAKTPLRSLSVQSLRGATTPVSVNFESSKTLTLIYGENGTGKTTICDAFDFIGNGKVGSLDGRGLGVTTAYWSSLGSAKSQILVELETTSGKWQGVFNKNAVQVKPVSGMPNISVLRRSQLLQLLQDTPANRYAVIRPFIDISPIEASENELRKLIAEIERQQTTASAVISENRAALEERWGVAGKPGSDYMTWAESEAKKSTAQLDKGLLCFRTVASAIVRVQNDASRVQQAEDKLQTSQRQFEYEENALSQAKASCLSDEVTTIELLLVAKAHLEGLQNVDHCPLCGSAEFAQGLPMQVAQRLEKLSALQSALTARNQAANSVAQQQTIVENERLRLEQALAQFRQAWESARDMFVAQGGDEASVLSALVTEIPDADLLLGVGQTMNRLIENLEASKSGIETLQLALDRYRTNYESQLEISRVLPNLRKSLTAMEEERRAYVDAKLKAIADEVGRLYEKLHPGEGLNKISLKLDPAKRGSLELGAEFLGQQDAPPHAYFSESHLDSLGLCIFLALAGLQGRENTILVLDDILGSIDEPHVDRLITLLYEESQQFLHCVLTTHYRPWKEKYRWGHMRPPFCQYVELKNWSPGKGVSHGKGAPMPVAELGKLLAEETPSPQLLCASAGVVLEATCDYLTAHYECSVPRRKGKPTLGDLLPSIDKKLKSVLKVESRQTDGSYLATELGPIFEQLQNTMQVRNIFGCHFNELAMHLPDQDAIDFARLVYQAAEALCCPEEGWPTMEKAGSYWATRSETRRLHPYRKPS